ncbi:ParA family protein [Massilia antarctica]|uniref:ParA family protein n=1 Tax=Massilia antarctica TaxID=2765360 RepID=UPI0006BB631E|nr:ParA family protein [Massilia sp. H27-R4]MCY0916447.1 ParA family protein [Massilia sp. H27-R4]
MFRSKFREAEDSGHALYGARQIRDIRMKLLGIPLDLVRSRKQPPLIVGRTAKGGVGKTTIVGNAATCLALSGYKVLLIDGDPQATLTGLFGIDWLNEDITHIGELMKRASQKLPTNIKSAVRPIYEGGMLDLIPADITMADDSWLIGLMNREQAFVRLLEQELDFFSQYDVIIVDSAPGSSLLATTFMLACKLLLAVVTPEPHSIAAMDVLASNVHEINSAFKNREGNLEVHIVVNKYNQTKKPHNEMLATLTARYPAIINDVIVRDFVGFLREADPNEIRTNGTVLEKEPNSVGARDIIDLTKSLIKRYDIRLADYRPGVEAGA